jgi:hypothetical protein
VKNFFPNANLTRGNPKSEAPNPKEICCFENIRRREATLDISQPRSGWN